MIKVLAAESTKLSSRVCKRKEAALVVNPDIKIATSYSSSGSTLLKGMPTGTNTVPSPWYWYKCGSAIIIKLPIRTEPRLKSSLDEAK